MHFSKFVATIVACSASLAAAAPVDVRAREAEAKPQYGSRFPTVMSGSFVLRIRRLRKVW